MNATVGEVAVAPLDPGLRVQVQAWLQGDPDPVDVAELADLLVRAEAAELTALQELRDRFAGPLSFGTAGLRGPLRAGPAGMNTAVVRRAAAGLARYLNDGGLGGGVVVIGCDARHRSVAFARDSAAVLAAAGFDVRLLPPQRPTPVLAYSVLALSAVAGVMVTASHNPPQDNGYKVYGADGAQIISPADTLIERAINLSGPASDIAMSAHFTELGSGLVADYVADISALLIPGGPRDLSVVYTAMHGVGSATLRAAFAGAGFAAPIEVGQQAEPDPDFPTVAFPNPEEPGAMDLALALAAERQADLIIANDPDADRCAVGVCTVGGRWRMLTGDQLGVLLADWLLHKGIRGTYATTIVSSSQLSALAASHGVNFVETLTGFKWISRAATDLGYGYEEALGYAVAPSLVRDKDGISAALTIAEMAAYYKHAGSSLDQRLAQLAAHHGRYLTRQLSWRVTDLSSITAAMARLRDDPPSTLLGAGVVVTDLLPAADVLSYASATARVVVRPSGTEPKLKAYLQVKDTDPGRESELLESDLTALAAEVTALLGL